MKSDSGDLPQKNTPLPGVSDPALPYVGEPGLPCVSDPALLCVGSPEAALRLKGITHVYTDLDGTLFAPAGKLLTAHDGTPSTAVAEALVSLKRAGIEVIIVTGRHASQGYEFLRLFNLQTFIGEHGCVVLEGGGFGQRVHYELGDWAHTVLADGLAPGELPDGVTPYELIEQSGVVARLNAAFPGKLEPAIYLPDTRQVTHAFRGFVDDDEVGRILAAETLPLELCDNGVIHPSRHTLIDCPEIHIYHLTPRGSSKALAVKMDLERRGVVRERAVAIGDSKSDVEMGDYTGALVVMGNALHSKTVLKALAARAARAARLEAGMRDRSEGEEAGPSRYERDATALYTQGFTADGWVEFAQALLAAR
ncbi:MAG: Cof-type HAD-IIB family hydrolase [Coriobacteriia bacterium]|nr:Cof-type HAD-IIB family hydrolase [Coriobacteriia bacterium]